MKYGDLLLVILGILLIMSIAFTIGVSNSLWFIPLIFFVVFILLYYDLKLKK